MQATLLVALMEMKITLATKQSHFILRSVIKMNKVAYGEDKIMLKIGQKEFYLRDCLKIEETIIREQHIDKKGKSDVIMYSCDYDPHCLYKLNDRIFINRNQAIEKAEKRRRSKIRRLEKQLENLNRMSIK